ncbi:hypothetical protein EZS27_016477 [termite gut metagenome]|uniref:Conjugative transposon TraM C-terminal domain-containing protein n=1 Tax=termite gut metagenome TaxID=433724 RepID=A0A5J4RP40_9ZZZZ
MSNNQCINNKKPVSNNKQENEGKLKLTGEQKQTMKKYAVFALMFTICGALMWLIFSPSADDKAEAEASAGFNTDIPLPKEEGLINDKRDAYEQGEMKERQEEKMRSLQDFSSLLDEEEKKPSKELALADREPMKQKNARTYSPQDKGQSSSFQTSADAYRDIHRTLGGFYETQREDTQKERLLKEVETLKARLQEKESNPSGTVNEQLTLMEESYKLAAKYLPLNAGTPTTHTEAIQTDVKNASGKTSVVPVSQVREQTVSMLPQDRDGIEIITAFGKPRNTGFLTAGTTHQGETKNTISACIHDNQIIADGQSVRLRLLEPMRAGGTLIPRNTLLSGQAKIQGERLGITVASLEYQGLIFPVELRVYDTDAQEGIFIPGSMEMDAVREIAAGMGTNAASSINLGGDATEQLAADMGRSLIQGTSQFFSKKLKEVKVNLKAGYKVFLLPKDN